MLKKLKNNIMKKALLGFVLAIITVFSVMAQSRTVTGKVTSADEPEGIPGVNVRVQGTTGGTITDIDGSYSLGVPQGSDVLVFSFVGFMPQTISVGNRTQIDVILVPDVRELNEVVVTALGVQRNRNELAYSAQEVDGDQITRTRAPNFVDALSGKVAGLDIRSNNTMGGSTNVIIRGYSSITGNNQALFVIDGVPVSNANTNTAAQQRGSVGADFGNAAADLNPDNIESVNVLKGAAATALYGSRAANGVIMITTKKGKKNALNVMVN